MFEANRWYRGEFKDSHEKVEIFFDNRHNVVLVWAIRLEKMYTYKNLQKVLEIFHVLSYKAL